MRASVRPARLPDPDPEPHAVRPRHPLALAATAGALALLGPIVASGPANADGEGNLEVSVMLASTLFFGAPDDGPMPGGVIDVFDADGTGEEPLYSFSAAGQTFGGSVLLDLPDGRYRIRASVDGYVPTWAGHVVDGGDPDDVDESIIGLIDAFHPFVAPTGFAETPVVEIEEGDESAEYPAHASVLASGSTSYVGGVVFTPSDFPGGEETAATTVELYKVGQGTPARSMTTERGIYVFDGVAKGNYQLRFVFDGVEQWWPFESDRSRAQVLPVTAVGGGYVALDGSFQEPTVGAPGDFLAIEGDPVEGGVLTLVPSMSSPFDNPELASSDRLSDIQWLVDGAPVLGATGPTFVVPPSAVGGAISATAAGSQLLGYERRALQTLPTAPVEASALSEISPAATPVIVGTPQLKVKLTTTLGTWRGGTDKAFQWFRGGVPIAGATGRNYTPTGPDVGQTLTFVVTGTRAGSQTTVRASAPTDPVIGAQFATPQAELRPVGQVAAPRVGGQLRAVHGAWGPAAEAWAYEWLRDGVTIEEAAGEYYTLAPDDLGATISARITGQLLGYESTTVETAPTAVVTEGTMKADRPVITPAPKVGVQLSVDLGSWNPVAEQVEIVWMRGAVVLATGPTFTPPPSAANKNLKVVVTGYATGYLPLEKQSVAVAVVP